MVFWASWCLPNAAEVAWLDEVYETHRDRGFRIVGINLDALQNGGIKVETVMPNIRRFLLEHNVRWPNLINGAGAHDYAMAYGVSEIPTNTLIGARRHRPEPGPVAQEPRPGGRKGSRKIVFGFRFLGFTTMRRSLRPIHAPFSRPTSGAPRPARLKTEN